MRARPGSCWNCCRFQGQFGKQTGGFLCYTGKKNRRFVFNAMRYLPIAMIIPAYNEAAHLQENMLTLAAVLDRDDIPFAAWLVDDGSADATWQEILRLGERDARFQGLRLSRHFGKEAALLAGLRAARGNAYLVLDADLQHPPGCVKEMLALLESSGAELVQGVKTDRGREKPLYRCLATGFYRLFHWQTGVDMADSSDFMLFSEQVKQALGRMNESSVFFRGLVSWVGFQKVAYPFAVAERKGEGSRFSRRRLLGFSLNALLSYTGKPLYLTALLGLVFCLAALALAAQTLINYFSGVAVSGFTTVILLQLLTGGALLLSLGIIGAYVARVFDQVKGRPAYIVAERTEERR